MCVCVCVCVCVFIHIYKYIYRERERGRETSEQVCSHNANRSNEVNVRNQKDDHYVSKHIKSL